MKTLLFVCVLGLLSFNAVSAGEGGAHPWEFIALYHLVPVKLNASDPASVGDYTFYFSKQKDEYADATFKLSYGTTPEEGQKGIEAVEPSADNLWDNTNATTLVANHPTTFMSKDKLYELHFDNNYPKSVFRFKVPASVGSDTHFVFFFQHFPSEFDLHLMDPKGNEIKAEATEPAAKKEKKSTEKVYASYNNEGLAVFASILVALCTLLGIFTAAGNCIDGSHFVLVLASAFAAGTLFSTTVMLILPEGVRLVDYGMGFENEALNNIVIGICLFFGFFLGAIIDVFVHFCGGAKDADPITAEIEMANKKDSKEATVEQGGVGTVDKPWYAITPKRWGRFVGTILVGDFMHNFIDGIAIAVAFQGCDVSGGWIVAGSAILHEIPQEVSDFLLLKLRGNMSTFEALFTNFLSGLSCIIGCGIALAANPTGMSQGIILLIAAGQYFWIATVECFPKILQVNSFKETCIHLGACLLGVLLISLVVIIHTHCSPKVISGGDDVVAAEDSGHAHGH